MSLARFAQLTWVSPAWSQLSVPTVLSFSLTLPRMASQSPLHLSSSFEYRSEMDFQKSKSLPAERAVDLFFLYGEIWKIPLALSSSLWRCLWSSLSSEEEGGFLSCEFSPPPDQLSSSLSQRQFSSFSRICIPASLRHFHLGLPFLPFSTLLLSCLEMSYSQYEDSSYLSSLLAILTTPIT